MKYKLNRTGGIKQYKLNKTNADGELIPNLKIRRCYICHTLLSIYNTGGTCFSCTHGAIFDSNDGPVVVHSRSGSSGLIKTV